MTLTSTSAASAVGQSPNECMRDFVRRVARTASGMIEYAVPSDDQIAVDAGQELGLMQVIENGVAMVTDKGENFAASTFMLVDGGSYVDLLGNAVMVRLAHPGTEFPFEDASLHRFRADGTYSAIACPASGFDLVKRG